MREVFLAALAGAVILISPTGDLVRAEDEAAEVISKFCKEHDNLGLSHGACVSFFTAENIVPHNADVCKMISTRNLLGVKNEGQCVKALKDLTL